MEALVEPYYPVNDEKNSALYAEYKKLAEAEKDVVFGGNYDMDQVVAAAIEMSKNGFLSIYSIAKKGFFNKICNHVILFGFQLLSIQTLLVSRFYDYDLCRDCRVCSHKGLQACKNTV